MLFGDSVSSCQVKISEKLVQTKLIRDLKFDFS